MNPWHTCFFAACLLLLIPKLVGGMMVAYNELKERWERYATVHLAVWADGRVLIRRGLDPATDEWRQVESPDTVVAGLRSNGWTIMEHWRPAWAEGATIVAVKRA
jgi:hypothetical protein